MFCLLLCSRGWLLLPSSHKLMDGAEKRREAGWKGSQWQGKWLDRAQPQYSHYFSVCRAGEGSILYYSSTRADPWMAGHHREPFAAQTLRIDAVAEKGGWKNVIRDLNSGTGQTQFHETTSIRSFIQSRRLTGTGLSRGALQCRPV